MEYFVFNNYNINYAVIMRHFFESVECSKLPFASCNV